MVSFIWFERVLLTWLTVLSVRLPCCSLSRINMSVSQLSCFFSRRKSRTRGSIRHYVCPCVHLWNNFAKFGSICILFLPNASDAAVDTVLLGKKLVELYPRTIKSKAASCTASFLSGDMAIYARSGGADEGFLGRVQRSRSSSVARLLRRERVGAYALRNARSRRWRLAKKYHLSSLHQKFQTGVVRGKSKVVRRSVEAQNPSVYLPSFSRVPLLATVESRSNGPTSNGNPLITGTITPLLFILAITEIRL